MKQEIKLKTDTEVWTVEELKKEKFGVSFVKEEENTYAQKYFLKYFIPYENIEYINDDLNYFKPK